MNNYCVYEHIFPNGKKYIGISKDAEARWANGNGYKSQKKVYRAIHHYGWDNIKHNIIINNVSEEQAKQLEKYLIAELDTIENGYNTTVGGDSILSTYLNAHVLFMIRESNELDKIYDQTKPKDGIVAIAENAKYNSKLAEIINAVDEMIEREYTEYKTYCGQHPIFDFRLIRCDCYWWTMSKLLKGEKLEKDQPYWRQFMKDLNFA